MVLSTTAALDRYGFGEAADDLRTSFWTQYCDFYLEAVKETSMAALQETIATRRSVLDTYLRLLHPFIPFVTEEIWQKLGNEGWLMQAEWPTATAELQENATVGVEAVIRLVTALRNYRATQKLQWKMTLDIWLNVKEHSDTFADCRGIVAHLSNGRWAEGDMDGHVLSDVACHAVVRE